MEGILLRVLEKKSGIFDWKIFSQDCHHPEKVILKLALLREKDNLVKAP